MKNVKAKILVLSSILFTICLYLLGCVVNKEYVSKNNYENEEITSEQIKAESKEVVASGEGIIENNNISSAKNKALKDALRNAVEQGIGTFVNSQSKVQNSQLIEDKIFSKSQGYVSKYEIISEKQEYNAFKITVRASVSLKLLKSDLFALKILRQQVDNPRIKIIISPESSNHTYQQAAESVKTQIERSFAEKHFEVVNANLQTPAEVVLEGKVNCEVNSAKLGDIAGLKLGLDMAKLNLSLKVFDPNSKQIFASFEMSQTGMGYGQNSAISNAGISLGKQGANKALDEIAKWWESHINEGTNYKVFFKNAQYYSDAVSFKNNVSKIENVKSLNERAFKDNILECEISYKGTKDEFIEAVIKQSGFNNLKIEHQGSVIIFSR